jgi:hypothetical protein
MTYRLTQLALAALIGMGLALALSAPDAFARDAGVADPALDAPDAPDAPAAVGTSPTPEPTIDSVWQRFRGKEILFGLAGAIWLLTGAAIKIGKPKSKWAKRAFAGVTSAVLAGALMIWGGAPLSGELLLTMISAAWMASGINEDAKDAAGVVKPNT